MAPRCRHLPSFSKLLVTRRTSLARRHRHGVTAARHQTSPRPAIAKQVFKVIMERSLLGRHPSGLELTTGSSGSLNALIASQEFSQDEYGRPRRRKPSFSARLSQLDPEVQDQDLVQLGPPKEMMLHLGDLPPAKRTPAVARLIVSACTLLLVAALMGLFVAVGNTRVDPLFVRTSSGPVLGKERGGADTWLGIPYATVPRRFAPSTPINTWHGQLVTLHTGAPCMQATGVFGYDIPGMQSKQMPAPSEDCLSLSIYAPRGLAEQARKDGAGARRVPVLFFLHGGSFVGGSGSQPMYNASMLAQEQQVLVVVPNYRLGPFGFFSHPELSKELGTPSGNQGIEDQSRALRWVRRNAFIFGGDPERITVWGQGAGAVSALLHVAAPRSSGKFRSIAAWSGGIDTGSPASGEVPLIGGAARTGTGELPTATQAESVGVAFASSAGCVPEEGQLACLRSLDGQEVAEAAAQGPWAAAWGPVRGGEVLPVDVGAVFRSPQAFRDALPGGLLLGHSMNDKRTTLRYRIAYQGAAGDEVDAVTGRRPNAREGSLVGRPSGLPPPMDRVSAAAARSFLNASLGLSQGQGVDAAVSFYGGDAGLTEAASARNFGVVAEAATDAKGLCLNRHTLRRAVAAGIPAWGARLDSRLSFVPSGEGAAHYQDLALGFGWPCYRQCSQTVAGAGFSPPEAGLGFGFRWSLANFARSGDPRSDRDAGYDDDGDDANAVAGPADGSDSVARPFETAGDALGRGTRDGWVRSAMEAQREQMEAWPEFRSADAGGAAHGVGSAAGSEGMLAMRSAGTHPASFSDAPDACGTLWDAQAS